MRKSSACRRLVQTYEKMKPKDAAQVFEELDMDLLLDVVVSRMNASGSRRRSWPWCRRPRSKEMTFELAQQKTLPFTP